ncbi:hypothetical protein [Paenarthrobacter sp. Y-19]|uniref:hypothetical protein n=1 Tax=Paenarthrobacter sp. Y-19 TaxID=3031125 RepID=UPI0023DA8851|nr:hypothetical protein [Paenarthrobacter sp. Y-19]
MTSEWVFDLKGKEVVFTGAIPGYSEAELTAMAVNSLGASRVKDDVARYSTDVLVRGYSARWRYGSYGNKEKQVAEMQRAGHHIQIIDAEGFFGLRSSLPAPALKPNVPVAPARSKATEGGTVGAPYRSGTYASALQGDGEHHRDPDIMDRGLKAHSRTQDDLAKHLLRNGFTPLSPFDRTCNYDIAWQLEDGDYGVAEVKSNTLDNEAFQIRHGLGQVLDYGHRLEGRGFRPRLFLVLEEKPREHNHWRPMCAAHDVTLTWGPDFPGVTDS